MVPRRSRNSNWRDIISAELEEERKKNAAAEVTAKGDGEEPGRAGEEDEDPGEEAGKGPDYRHTTEFPRGQTTTSGGSTTN
jgi:hypothetical protein